MGSGQAVKQEHLSGVHAGPSGKYRPITEQRPMSNKIGIGIAIGTAIGVAIGTAIENIGAGIAIGIAVGAGIGVAMQEGGKKAESDDQPGDDKDT